MKLFLYHTNTIKGANVKEFLNGFKSVSEIIKTQSDFFRESILLYYLKTKAVSGKLLTLSLSPYFLSSPRNNPFFPTRKIKFRDTLG